MANFMIRRVLRALGFRLVFPIGTMPVPYHPLVFPLAITGLIGWLGLTIAGRLDRMGEGPIWWQPIAPFLVLGVLMSLPIVAWAAMVVRAPLLQGLLGAAIPVLVAVEVLTGTLPPAWLALPFAYAATFVFQAWYGPRWLAQVKARNEAFVPVEPGQVTLALQFRTGQPQNLLDDIDAASIWARKVTGKDGYLFHRLTLEDADRIEAAKPSRLPRSWQMSRRESWAVLVQPCAEPPADSIPVWDRKARAPWWCVTGLREFAVRIDKHTFRLRQGKAALVGKLPLFVLFHWTAIFGGKSEWQIGFPRTRAEKVDFHSPQPSSALRSLFASRPETGGTTDTTHVNEIIAHFEKLTAEERSEADALIARQEDFWSELPSFADLPKEFKPVQEALASRPEAVDQGRLGDVLDWLERCRDTPSQAGFYRACALLDTFPDEVLLAEGARIATIFNSRRIALQWNIAHVPDPDKLPPRTPVCAMNTAGFGVFKGYPHIYQRLGDLLPQMAGVNEGLAREYANPEPGLRTAGTIRSL